MRTGSRAGVVGADRLAREAGTDVWKHLARSGMTIVSGVVSGWVLDYECTRVWSEHSTTDQSFCRGVTGLPMTEDRCGHMVTAYLWVSLRDVLLSGSWIVDEQPGTELGDRPQIDAAIVRIPYHYAPSRPTICVVGPFIRDGGGYRFDASLLQDVTDDPCDAVGIYVYFRDLHSSGPHPRLVTGVRQGGKAYEVA
jgi:hypothetical protein